MNGLESRRSDAAWGVAAGSVLLSPVVLLVGALIAPGVWLVVPALGTGLCVAFVAMLARAWRSGGPGPVERARRLTGQRARRRRNSFAITRHLPASVTLTREVGDLALLWADTMPPDNFGPGHLENRMEGFVAARRSSNSEPTRFTGFEHVDPDGGRRWYLMVPLPGPLPPLEVIRERGVRSEAAFRTGDPHFDRLYRITSTWSGAAATQAYLAAFFSEPVVAQMKEVAFAWRVRGRFLIATPEVDDAAKAVAYAQNFGTQLALIADRLPEQLFARYADWYAPFDGLPPGLANPDDLR
ncbi:hypothetical protein CGZ93_12295 [Enemella dayhoffiae]|uniref:DUF3137 domain-containing protein n=1 Tax=Enemella dayhoffiae TaxID=2016507 RepID=A0A255GZD1_9ACTN|nr:hypothetical protein [Enemella dayhoffiae]OYO20980.1 hypothetical protein CGZ93_12295 [Enemella dayhoffiae]